MDRINLEFREVCKFFSTATDETLNNDYKATCKTSADEET